VQVWTKEAYKLLKVMGSHYLAIIGGDQMLTSLAGQTQASTCPTSYPVFTRAVWKCQLEDGAGRCLLIPSQELTSYVRYRPTKLHFLQDEEIVCPNRNPKLQFPEISIEPSPRILDLHQHNI